MNELTLAVVGIDFPNADGSNRRSEAMMTLPGEPVRLVPEPRNRHDGNAVAVFSPRGVQLGYISAERAPLVRSRLNRGEDARAIFQGIDGAAAFIRVRFDGGAPVLPPATTSGQDGAASTAPRPQDGDIFYPDPDGPEWGA